ncbi:MAG: hypothetical protein ACO1N1_24830 [Dyadobacter fermentans]
MIASLLSGEFAGMVGDDLMEKISLKIFRCEILTDHEAIAKEEGAYRPIHIVRAVDHAMGAPPLSAN